MVANLDLENFYRKTGQAVILYDLNILRSQLELFRKAFQSTGRTVEIAYSYKTNPLLAEVLYKGSCKMEVTCREHLLGALKFCSGKETIIYTPTLDNSLIKKCLSENVHIIADSITQLKKINEIAPTKTKVGLRVNTRVQSDAKLSASGSSLGMLGVSEETLIKNLDVIQGMGNITFAGIHNHFASQNLDLNSWKENAVKLQEIVSKLENLEYLNVGGGYPIDYQDNPPGIEEIVSALFGPLAKLPKEMKIIAEPGRILAGPCGTLLAEVSAVKNDVVDTVFLNASIFSTFPDRLLSNFSFNNPIQIVSKPAQKGNNTFYIRGNSPSSDDFFGILKNSPEITAGDIIAIRNIGAYGTVEASSFCGAQKPPEYIIDGDTVQRCA